MFHLCYGVLFVTLVSSSSFVLVPDSESLRYYVEQTSSPQLSLSPSTVYYLNSSLKITRQISILGAPGSTLDCQNKTRAFEILNYGDLTLSSLTIQYGLGGSPPLYASALGAPPGGGCISLYTMTNADFGTAQRLRLDSVVFRHCKAISGSGGAILVYAPYASTVAISNSTFDSNFAQENGGAIYFSIYPYNTLAFGLEFSLLHTRMKGNSALLRGGAVFLESAAIDVRMAFMDFSLNQAGSLGGAAIAMQESLSISNSTFAPNNTVALLNPQCILSVDSFSNTQLVGLISAFLPSQVVQVLFTPKPTPAPFTLITARPTAPTTFSPTPLFVATATPSSLTTADSGSSTIVIVSLCVVFGLLFFVLVLYFKRKYASSAATNRLPPDRLDSMEEMERNNENMMKRRQGANILDIKDNMLFPCDDMVDPCPICLEGGPCSEEAFQTSRLTVSRGFLDDTTLTHTFCKLTSCGHFVHTACLITWIEVNRHAECPFCRSSVAKNLRQRFASTTASAAPLFVPNPQGESHGELRRSNQQDDTRAETGILIVPAEHA